MEISIFDVIGNGISNKDIIENIKKKLQKKYKIEFNVKKIGNRYGIFTNDTVTTYCCPKYNENIIFIAKLNKEQTVLEDDYLLKCISYEIEESIKKEFQENNIEIIAKNKIIGKSNLSEQISVQEFINKYKGANFLTYIISSQKISAEVLKEIYEKLKQKYKGIYLKTLIYIIDENGFENCKEIANQSPTIMQTMLEEQTIKEEIIIKIKEGKIYRIGEEN